jgi:hypothetical protein
MQNEKLFSDEQVQKLNATGMQNIVVSVFKIFLKEKPNIDENYKKLIQYLLIISENTTVVPDNIETLKMMEKRISIYGYEIDNKLKYFLSTVYKDSYSNILLYLYYFNYVCKFKNISKITFDMFLTKPYFGLLTDNQLSYIWNNQQIERNNMKLNVVDIDFPE